MAWNFDLLLTLKFPLIQEEQWIVNFPGEVDAVLYGMVASNSGQSKGITAINNPETRLSTYSG